MRSAFSMTALAAGLFAFPPPGLAEHARITLDVASPGRQVTAFVDQTPPESGKIPRPVLKAKVGETIKVKYLLTNVDPHKILPDVVVHFFIVRQEKVGQKEIPPLGDDVVLETAFDLDFRPGGKAGARNTLRIDSPGVYLIRVETRNTNSDHEHFAAVDLVIEADKP